MRVSDEDILACRGRHYGNCSPMPPGQSHSCLPGKGNVDPPIDWSSPELSAGWYDWRSAPPTPWPHLDLVMGQTRWPFSEEDPESLQALPGDPPPLTPDRAVQVPSPTESGPLHGPGTNGSCGQLNVKSDALQAQALEISRSTGCPTGAQGEQGLQSRH